MYEGCWVIKIINVYISDIDFHGFYKLVKLTYSLKTNVS